MHYSPAASPASRPGAFLRVARAGLLGTVLLLVACKGGDAGKEGDTDGDDAKSKGPEAVAVEVARAAHRPIAAA